MDLGAIIPMEAVVASAIALAATIGAHVTLARAIGANPNPWVTIILYVFGAALCAMITYGAWNELAPPASMWASIGMGFAHPFTAKIAMNIINSREPWITKRKKGPWDL